MTVHPIRSTSSTTEEDHIKRDKLSKALDGQSLNTGPLRYMFTESLLICDAKATLNQAALDIGIRTVDNFDKVLVEMTKHPISAYVFHEQKRYIQIALC